MPPITPAPTGIVCAQPGCGLDIALQGDMWVHPHTDNGWYRNCDAGRSPNHATPAQLDVTRYVHSGASESWHVMHDETEYVVWLHGAIGRFSAWRTALVAMGPDVTVYYDTDANQTSLDPKPLLDRMPPLVAHWLRDAIYPF